MFLTFDWQQFSAFFWKQTIGPFFCNYMPGNKCWKTANVLVYIPQMYNRSLLRVQRFGKLSEAIQIIYLELETMCGVQTSIPFSGSKILLALSS